ncbi:carbohydrate sulfotransferase 14-like [Lytechinus pictus]|uniref:carbohydrate sulfotransferase 14-like n=1 Tax=Lytechinus pictus TaxID=7653 RepID=UPI0030B9EE92
MKLKILILVTLCIAFGIFAIMTDTEIHSKLVQSVQRMRSFSEQLSHRENIDWYTAHMTEIQLERRQRLQKACNNLGYHSSNSSALTADQLRRFSNLMVIPKLKVVYCYVPKVGCTSWKALLLNMSGYLQYPQNSHDKARAVFPSLSNFDVEKAREITAGYKSFMFVRNPFTRILSAYRDKITLDNGKTWRRLLFNWLSVADPHEAKLYNDASRNFTFNHFIRFYLSSSVKNEHWREIDRLCLPCQVNYDFIGKFDHLYEDSSYLISKLTNDSHVELPHRQKKTNSSDDTTLRQFYSGVPPDLLRQLVMDEGVVKEMALFGFHQPSVITELLDKQTRENCN